MTKDACVSKPSCSHKTSTSAGKQRDGSRQAGRKSSKSLSPTRSPKRLQSPSNSRSPRSPKRLQSSANSRSPTKLQSPADSRSPRSPRKLQSPAKEAKLPKGRKKLVSPPGEKVAFTNTLTRSESLSPTRPVKKRPVCSKRNSLSPAGRPVPTRPRKSLSPTLSKPKAAKSPKAKSAGGKTAIEKAPAATKFSSPCRQNDESQSPMCSENSEEEEAAKVPKGKKRSTSQVPKKSTKKSGRTLVKTGKKKPVGKAKAKQKLRLQVGESLSLLNPKKQSGAKSNCMKDKAALVISVSMSGQRSVSPGRLVGQLILDTLEGQTATEETEGTEDQRLASLAFAQQQQQQHVGQLVFNTLKSQTVTEGAEDMGDQPLAPLDFAEQHEQQQQQWPPPESNPDQAELQHIERTSTASSKQLNSSAKGRKSTDGPKKQKKRKPQKRQTTTTGSANTLTSNPVDFTDQKLVNESSEDVEAPSSLSLKIVSVSGSDGTVLSGELASETEDDSQSKALVCVTSPAYCAPADNSMDPNFTNFSETATNMGSGGPDNLSFFNVGPSSTAVNYTDTPPTSVEGSDPFEESQQAQTVFQTPPHGKRVSVEMSSPNDPGTHHLTALDSNLEPRYTNLWECSVTQKEVQKPPIPETSSKPKVGKLKIKRVVKGKVVKLPKGIGKKSNRVIVSLEKASGVNLRPRVVIVPFDHLKHCGSCLRTEMMRLPECQQGNVSKMVNHASVNNTSKHGIELFESSFHVLPVSGSSQGEGSDTLPVDSALGVVTAEDSTQVLPSRNSASSSPVQSSSGASSSREKGIKPTAMKSPALQKVTSKRQSPRVSAPSPVVLPEEKPAESKDLSFSSTKKEHKKSQSLEATHQDVCTKNDAPNLKKTLPKPVAPCSRSKPHKKGHHNAAKKTHRGKSANDFLDEIMGEEEFEPDYVYDECETGGSSLDDEEDGSSFEGGKPDDDDDEKEEDLEDDDNAQTLPNDDVSIESTNFMIKKYFASQTIAATPTSSLGTDEYTGNDHGLLVTASNVCISPEEQDPLLRSSSVKLSDGRSTPSPIPGDFGLATTDCPSPVIPSVIRARDVEALREEDGMTASEISERKRDQLNHPTQTSIQSSLFEPLAPSGEQTGESQNFSPSASAHGDSGEKASTSLRKVPKSSESNMQGTRASPSDCKVKSGRRRRSSNGRSDESAESSGKNCTGVVDEDGSKRQNNSASKNANNDNHNQNSHVTDSPSLENPEDQRTPDHKKHDIDSEAIPSTCDSTKRRRWHKISTSSNSKTAEQCSSASKHRIHLNRHPSSLSTAADAEHEPEKLSTRDRTDPREGVDKGPSQTMEAGMAQGLAETNEEERGIADQGDDQDRNTPGQEITVEDRMAPEVTLEAERDDNEQEFSEPPIVQRQLADAMQAEQRSSREGRARKEKNEASPLCETQTKLDPDAASRCSGQTPTERESPTKHKLLAQSPSPSSTASTGATRTIRFDKKAIKEVIKNLKIPFTNLADALKVPAVIQELQARGSDELALNRPVSKRVKGLDFRASVAGKVDLVPATADGVLQSQSKSHEKPAKFTTSRTDQDSKKTAAEAVCKSAAEDKSAERHALVTAAGDKSNSTKKASNSEGTAESKCHKKVKSTEKLAEASKTKSEGEKRNKTSKSSDINVCKPPSLNETSEAVAACPSRKRSHRKASGDKQQRFESGRSEVTRLSSEESSDSFQSPSGASSPKQRRKFKDAKKQAAFESPTDPRKKAASESGGSEMTRRSSEESSDSLQSPTGVSGPKQRRKSTEAKKQAAEKVEKKSVKTSSRHQSEETTRSGTSKQLASGGKTGRNKAFTDHKSATDAQTKDSRNGSRSANTVTDKFLGKVSSDTPLPRISRLSNEAGGKARKQEAGKKKESRQGNPPKHSSPLMDLETVKNKSNKFNDRRTKEVVPDKIESRKERGRSRKRSRSSSPRNGEKPSAESSSSANSRPAKSRSKSLSRSPNLEDCSRRVKDEGSARHWSPPRPDSPESFPAGGAKQLEARIKQCQQNEAWVDLASIYRETAERNNPIRRLITMLQGAFMGSRNIAQSFKLFVEALCSPAKFGLKQNSGLTTVDKNNLKKIGVHLIENCEIVGNYQQCGVLFATLEDAQVAFTHLVDLPRNAGERSMMSIMKCLARRNLAGACQIVQHHGWLMEYQDGTPILDYETRRYSLERLLNELLEEFRTKSVVRVEDTNIAYNILKALLRLLKDRSPVVNRLYHTALKVCLDHLLLEPYRKFYSLYQIHTAKMEVDMKELLCNLQCLYNATAVDIRFFHEALTLASHGALVGLFPNTFPPKIDEDTQQPVPGVLSLWTVMSMEEVMLVVCGYLLEILGLFDDVMTLRLIPADHLNFEISVSGPPPSKYNHLFRGRNKDFKIIKSTVTEVLQHLVPPLEIQNVESDLGQGVTRFYIDSVSVKNHLLALQPFVLSGGLGIPFISREFWPPRIRAKLEEFGQGYEDDTKAATGAFDVHGVALSGHPDGQDTVMSNRRRHLSQGSGESRQQQIPPGTSESRHSASSNHNVDSRMESPFNPVVEPIANERNQRQGSTSGGTDDKGHLHHYIFLDSQGKKVNEYVSVGPVEGGRGLQPTVSSQPLAPGRQRNPEGVGEQEPRSPCSTSSAKPRTETGLKSELGQESQPDDSGMGKTQSFTNLDSPYRELQSLARHYAMQSGMTFDVPPVTDSHVAEGPKSTVSRKVISGTGEGQEELSLSKRPRMNWDNSTGEQFGPGPATFEHHPELRTVEDVRFTQRSMPEERTYFLSGGHKSLEVCGEPLGQLLAQNPRDEQAPLNMFRSETPPEEARNFVQSDRRVVQRSQQELLPPPFKSDFQSHQPKGYRHQPQPNSGLDYQPNNLARPQGRGVQGDVPNRGGFSSHEFEPVDYPRESETERHRGTSDLGSTYSGSQHSEDIEQSGRDFHRLRTYQDRVAAWLPEVEQGTLGAPGSHNYRAVGERATNFEPPRGDSLLFPSSGADKRPLPSYQGYDPCRRNRFGVSGGLGGLEQRAFDRERMQRQLQEERNLSLAVPPGPHSRLPPVYEPRRTGLDKPRTRPPLISGPVPIPPPSTSHGLPGRDRLPERYRYPNPASNQASSSSHLKGHRPEDVREFIRGCVDNRLSYHVKNRTIQEAGCRAMSAVITNNFYSLQRLKSTALVMNDQLASKLLLYVDQQVTSL